MSKGLKALKELRKQPIYDTRHFDNIDLFDVIEKELKVNEIAIDFINRIADLLKEHDLEELEDKIIKTLKALEIIKALAIFIISQDIGGFYSLETIVDSVSLTKEDYELLKEVLEND